MENNKIIFSKCTKSFLKKTFFLEQIQDNKLLENWINQSKTIELDDIEFGLLKRIQKTLNNRVDDWNEYELSEHFISPIMALVDFNTANFSAFVNRTISAQINGYELYGKPDFFVARGESEPETPFFCFQEYKKEIDPEGHPTYQALAEMLVARELNNNKIPIYGVSVMGKVWNFITLKNNEYTISKSYAADDEEIFEIFKILKALKNIIIENSLK